MSRKQGNSSSVFGSYVPLNNIAKYLSSKDVRSLSETSRFARESLVKLTKTKPLKLQDILEHKGSSRFGTIVLNIDNDTDLDIFMWFIIK